MSIPYITVGADLSDTICTEPVHLNNDISLDFYEQGINIENIPNIDLVEKKESFYYDEDNFVEYLKGDHNIICLSSNVQSLHSKFNSISIFFNFIEKNAINVDVFALQETWKINNPNTVKLPGFKLFFKDRAVGRGGGVGLYVRDIYHSILVENCCIFKENIFESIVVKVEKPESKTAFIVASLYRPNRHKTSSPSNQLNQFFEHFYSFMEKLTNLNLPIYIFTDTNIDLLKYGAKAEATELLDFSTGLGFKQLISKATRIHGQSHSLIDHIFVNKFHSSEKSGIIVESFSDHFITFTTLNLNKPKQKKQAYVQFRDFSQTNIDIFKNSIENLTCVLNSQCPNTAYDIFWDTFKFFFNIYFPLVSKKCNKTKHPINEFMTAGLLISRKKNLNLLKKAKIKPTQFNITQFPFIEISVINL